MQKKSIKPWVILLIAPWCGLVLLSLLQLIVRGVLLADGQDPNAFTLVINIISLLVGIASVLMILAAPIWIIMLIIASNNNSKIDAQNTSPALPPTEASPIPPEPSPPAPAPSTEPDQPFNGPPAGSPPSIS